MLRFLITLSVISTLFISNMYSQTIDVNVLTYNILNYPNGNTSMLDGDAARAIYFRQIVEDANADIIIVQELRSTEFGNVEGLANATILLDELNTNGTLGKNYAMAPDYFGYGSLNFGLLGNMLFYNADLFNFEAITDLPSPNTTTSNNGNTVRTPRPPTHYELSYPKVPTCDEQLTSLHVISAHLKAGFDNATSSEISDEARRDLGAQDIIDFISTSLSSTDNIIIGGDFNFQGSAEDGYITLTNGVTNPYTDPLGPWTREDPALISMYTQSTRATGVTYNNGGATSGLDDRFDLWFHNDVIQNGSDKITYIANSYENWGNVNVPWNASATDGSYFYNQEIELMSDHYPVLMQLRIDAPTTLCDNPLAIEGLDFNVEAINGLVELNWSTERELDNQGFEIQHSTNGSQWNKIGFVSGSSNSSQKLFYEFQHLSPVKGFNYYRLKQLDEDGRFHFSNIESVDLGKFNNTNAIVYPDPVGDVLNIAQFEGKGFIYDISGQLIFNFNCNSFAQNEVPVNRLHRGTYLLTLVGANGVRTSQLIVKE